ncbi:MAG: hypothetical protein XD83_1181 [Synergistales bacterium 57_84]|nr:MAG: hypothetical protein XD83_1181 [Synergistales bacterium 57_84]
MKRRQETGKRVYPRLLVYARPYVTSTVTGSVRCFPG